jgi:hypothetical protein
MIMRRGCHRSRGCVAAGFAALGLLSWLGAGCTPEAAADPCRDVAGTYLTTINDIEGVFASRGLVTFTADGAFLVGDSGQGGSPGVYEPFSLGQGSWACDAAGPGAVKVKATALNFTLPDSNARRALGRVDYEATLDPEGLTISGTVALRFTPEGDLEASDPIGAPGEVAEEFSFSGKRVVAP